MVTDPEKIELSLPYARGLEEIFLSGMKASTVSDGEYSTYRVISTIYYQTLPDPGSPDAPVMRCTVRATATVSLCFISEKYVATHAALN